MRRTSRIDSGVNTLALLADRNALASTSAALLLLIVVLLLIVPLLGAT